MEHLPVWSVRAVANSEIYKWLKELRIERENQDFEKNKPTNSRVLFLQLKLFGNEQHCGCERDVDVCVNLQCWPWSKCLINKIKQSKWNKTKGEQVSQISPFTGRKAKARKLVPVDLWCPYKSPSIFSKFIYFLLFCAPALISFIFSPLSSSLWKMFPLA